MGDNGAGNPRTARSKGGIVGEVSLKCDGVLGPAAPMVVSGEALGWASVDWLDWEHIPNSGSNTESASNSSSNAEWRLDSLGVLYGLG